MASIQNIQLELSDLNSLRAVASAYSDISALKIQSLREAFDQNALYYEQISQIYQSVRASAIMQKYLKDNKKLVPNLKPKTLHVAITSNHRFYGTTNSDVLERFISESKIIHDDRLIIGTTGNEYVKGRTEMGPYNTLVFQDDMPPKVEIDAFLNLTRPYERVFLYFPKFVNMLTQTVDKVDISFSPRKLNMKIQPIKYIFEPELPKILSFFELHIRSLLFDRVMLETELARTATRLLAMDTAERNAEEKIAKTRTTLIMAKQSYVNRGLLETFSRIILWKRK